MIRRCAVLDCENTDEICLCHRFPENKILAQAWKDSLKLQEFPIELLQSKFIVCKNHFSNCDYENEVELLATAIPKLEDSPTYNEARVEELVQVDEVNSSVNADSESIEIVAPTIEAMVLLHPTSHKMLGSCNSTSSTNYTSYSHDDICILGTNISRYGMDSFESQHNCVLMQSVDAPDFTVVNPESECKYLKTRESTYPFDESTEIIYDHSDSRKKQGHAISNTDSDVEILMSEEILDSDWSAANAGILEPKLTTSETEEHLVSCGSSGNTANVSNEKIRECTDHDITEDDFSLNSEDLYEQLNRTQLINVIKEQAAKIRVMETTLSRYQLAQKKLFQHIDAMRLEFEI